MFESMSSSFVASSYSACPFCLEEMVPSETTDSSVVFKEFLRFSKVYLKVSTGERLFLRRTTTGSELKPIPQFCESCEDKVKEVLELHWELEKLKCKLVWKLMTIGQVIATTERRTQGGQPTGCHSSTHYGNTTTGLLRVFRKQVARKCELKAKRILPTVSLKNSSVIGNFPETDQRVAQLGASHTEIQCLVGLVILYSSVYGWNLAAIANLFPASKKVVAFEKVIAECRIITIPTRQTLQMFTSLFLVYSIGDDWNLEEIILQYSQNNEPPQHKVIKRKRGRPPGIRANIDNCSSSQNLVSIPPSPMVAKRGPGRPPKSVNLRNSVLTENFSGIPKISLPSPAAVKRGPGRPPKSGTNLKPQSTTIPISAGPPNMKKRGPPGLNTKTIFLQPPKRKVGRPKKIRLETKQNHDIDFNGQEEKKARLADKLVEKTEVEIPSPEPSMVEIDFQGDDDDDDYGHAQDYFCNSPVDESMGTPPMDVANDENSNDPDERSEGTNSTFEKCADDDIPPPPPHPIKVEQQESQQDPSLPVVRKRGRPWGSIKVKRGPGRPSKTGIDMKPLFKRRVGRPKTKRRVSRQIQYADSSASSEDSEVSIKVKRSPSKRQHFIKKGRSKRKPYSCALISRIPFGTTNMPRSWFIKCTSPICSLTFETLFPFHEHVRTVHSRNAVAPKNDHACKSCEETFESELVLMSHLKENHENPKEKGPSYFCIYCCQSFQTEQLCELHRKNSHWLHPQHVYCESEECSEQFTSPIDLTNHYSTVHASPDDDDATMELFSCDQCHWSFLTERRLHLHRLNHLQPNGVDQVYQCPKCPRRYLSAMKLAVHFNRYKTSYHLPSKHKLKNWDCANSQCHFSFFTEKELSAHQKLHQQYNLGVRSRPRELKNESIKSETKCSPSTKQQCKAKLMPNQNAASISTFGTDLPKNTFIKCGFPDCVSTFETLFPFQDHLQTDHCSNAPLEQSLHQCRSCEQVFKSESSLMSHIQTDHESSEEKSPHVCFYCCQSFRTEQLCELHRRNVHWLHPQQLHCEVGQCSQEFTSTEQLAEHYRVSHASTVTELFVCDQCHWSFESMHRLRLHYFSHMEPSGNDKSFQCFKCSNRYLSAMALANHFNSYTKHHPKRRTHKLNTWYCPSLNCDFSFFSENALIAHQKLHEQHSLTATIVSVTKCAPKFHCLYCWNVFSSIGERDVHEPSCPSGPSPEKRLKMKTTFACVKCSYTSDKRSSFQRHVTIHQNAMFPCLECGHKFGRADHLRVHMKRKHSTCLENKLVCHLCGVKRVSEADLKYHISEHERKHLCPECGKKFTRAWLLSVHMRKHTGERIQCEFCPTFYRTVPQLKSHYQSGHPEEFQRVYGGNMKMRVKYKLVKKGDKAYCNGRVKKVGEVETLGTSDTIKEQQPGSSYNTISN